MQNTAMVKKVLKSAEVGKRTTNVGVQTKVNTPTKVPLENGTRWTAGGAYRVGGKASLTGEEIADKFSIEGFEIVKEKDMIGEWGENMVLVSYCMLELGFKLPLDVDVAKLLVYYDASPCQMSGTFWLVVARARELENVYGRRFGFSEIARCITIKNLMNHLITVSCDSKGFYGIPSTFKHVNKHRYVCIGDWNRTGLPVRNRPRRDKYRPEALPENPLASSHLDYYFQDRTERLLRNLRWEDNIVKQTWRKNSVPKVITRREEEEEEVPIRDIPEMVDGSEEEANEIANEMERVVDNKEDMVDEEVIGIGESMVEENRKRKGKTLRSSSDEGEEEVGHDEGEKDYGHGKEASVSGVGTSEGQVKDSFLGLELMIGDAVVIKKVPSNEPEVIELWDSPKVEYVQSENSRLNLNVKANASTSRPRTLDALLSAIGVEVPGFIEKIRAAAVEQYGTPSDEIEDELKKSKARTAHFMMEAMFLKGRLSEVKKKNKQLEEENTRLKLDSKRSIQKVEEKALKARETELLELQRELETVKATNEELKAAKEQADRG
ncbi:hypothetical protein FRX31_022724, partial [Thalictrum thalictroides]